MGSDIIDDFYKQEVEELDNAFLEAAQGKKKSEGLLRKYLKDFKKSRDRYEKKYARHLMIERLKIKYSRKKKKKQPKFKHLKVKRFDFRFNFFERFRMSLIVFWFNFMRVIRRTWLFMVPKFLIYFFYKSVRWVSWVKRVISDEIDYKRAKAKNKLIKFFTAVIERLKGVLERIAKRFKRILKKIKKIFKKIRKVVRKFLKPLRPLMFWKDPKEEGEEDEDEDDEEESFEKDSKDEKTEGKTA